MTVRDHRGVGARARRLADVALRTAAALWFFVTLTGQWLFLYYIVAVYGASTVTGHFEAWKNKMMFSPGDTVANLTFAAHVVFAAVIALGGVVQLIPQIRARAIAVHRWNGRAFLVAAAVASIDGLYMKWARHAQRDPVDMVSANLDAVLVLVFAALAWRAARRHDIDSHRRWALRTFMVVNAPALFIRVLAAAWSVLAPGVGMKAMNAPRPMHFLLFASYLLPLGVLELYLRARTSTRAIPRLATAIVLLAFTAYMAVGTLAAAMARRAIVG
jgi:uncharacterized membrane protein